MLKNVTFLEEGSGPEGASSGIPTKVLSDMMTFLCGSLGCPSTLECAVHGAEGPVLKIAVKIPLPSGEIILPRVSELCSCLEEAMKALQPFQKHNSSKR